MSRLRGLEIIGIDTKTIRGNAALCPKCSHTRKKKRDRCLSVNIQTGHYNCNHCDFQGRADSNEWIEKQEQKRLAELSKSKTQKVDNRKPFITKPITQKGISYLGSRGISKEVVDALSIAEFKNALIFNYYSSGKIVAAKYRMIEGKKMWQHKDCIPTLYNCDALKHSETIIFVEGEMDVLSLFEAGFKNVVSVNQGAPGANDTTADAKLKCLETHAKGLAKVKKFIIAVDQDEPGKRLEKELINRLGRSKCSVVSFPQGCKDANDVLVKLGKEKLINCISSAKALPVTGVIPLEDVRGEMLESWKHGVKTGETTHYPVFDRRFKWMRGDLNVWTGLPNTGKSEFIKNLLLLKTLNDGCKWAIFTPEHFPASDFYDELIETMVGKSVERGNPNRMSFKEYEMAMDVVSKFFFFIYPQPNEGVTEKEAMHTPDTIIKKIKELKLRKDIDGYLVDPWNQMMHTGMERREDLYLAVQLSKFDRLNKEYNLFGNIVAHPKAIPPDKDGIIRKPTGYDISGGPMWMNKTANLIVIHRYKVDGVLGNEIEIDVQKIKKQRRVGRPGLHRMTYNLKNGWYTEYNDDFNSYCTPMSGLFRELFFGEQSERTGTVENLPDAQAMKKARENINDDDIPF